MTEAIHYAIALLGWFLYNLLILNVNKDKLDEAGKRFDWKVYKGKYWDNWAFTLLLAPILVFYMDDITAIIGHWLDKEIPHYDIYFLGCGVLTELVYYGLSRLMMLRGKSE